MQAFPFAAVVYHITLKASDTYSYETYHYLGAPTLFARLDVFIYLSIYLTCSSVWSRCTSTCFAHVDVGQRGPA